jgi:hypothetical protein
MIAIRDCFCASHTASVKPKQPLYAPLTLRSHTSLIGFFLDGADGFKKERTPLVPRREFFDFDEAIRLGQFRHHFRFSK